MINTVGELRSALADVPDDAIVQISYLPKTENIWYAISIDSIKLRTDPQLIELYKKKGIKTSGIVHIDGVPPEFPKDKDGNELY